MTDPLRAALRVVRERLTDDGFRALAHAMLDAADEAARAEAIEHARQVLDGDTPCPR